MKSNSPRSAVRSRCTNEWNSIWCLRGPAVVVRCSGGAVDKFTGDEVQRLAVEVLRRNHIALRLRVGLSSGRVVALGYTPIGEQVGMAQRMESVARPGG